MQPRHLNALAEHHDLLIRILCHGLAATTATRLLAWLKRHSVERPPTLGVMPCFDDRYLDLRTRL